MRRAFSLIEVLIALVLALAIGALVFPSYVRQAAERTFTSADSDLAAVFASAQAQAISTHQTLQIIWDDQTSTLTVRSIGTDEIARLANPSGQPLSSSNALAAESDAGDPLAQASGIGAGALPGSDFLSSEVSGSAAQQESVVYDALTVSLPDGFLVGTDPNQMMMAAVPDGSSSSAIPSPFSNSSGRTAGTDTTGSDAAAGSADSGTDTLGGMLFGASGAGPDSTTASLSNDDPTSSASTRQCLGVVLPDGSILAPHVLYMTDGRGRWATLTINPWTGAVTSRRVQDSTDSLDESVRSDSSGSLDNSQFSPVAPIPRRTSVPGESGRPGF